MPTTSDKLRTGGPAKQEIMDGGTTADDSSADEIETVRGTPRTRRRGTFSDTAALLDTVRKWGANQALLWYRNNRDDWRSWADFEKDFRRYFVPTRTRFELEAEIARRTQGPNETAREYVTALQTLMRRHGGITPEDRLERIYHNLRPEYHLYARRNDFLDLPGLLRLTDDYERARRYEREYQPPKGREKPKTAAAAIIPAYDSLREGEGTHPELPRHAGKRQADRGERGGPPVYRQPGHRRVRAQLPSISPRNETTDPRPWGTIEIAGQQHDALLDCGAILSYVAEDTAERIRPYAQVRRIAAAVQLADGRTGRIDEEMRVQIRLGRYRGLQTFHVLPGLTSTVIAGVHLLRKAGFRWSLPTIAALRPAETSTAEPTAGLTACSDEQNMELQALLDEFLPKFTQLRGTTPLTEHRIRLKSDQEPIRQRYRTFNPALQGIIEKEIDEMLHEGHIEPTSSPWNSGVVLAKKKDGRYRFCIDFRKVNEVTVRDAYPLPPVQHILDQLREARFLSTIDLKNGYWQVALHPDNNDTVLCLP
ncbi:uncharacterized protein LOC118645194 [Monomorium pharaonis]|uniref:uncharacterized protein LOC118645194 n=1 Tax=Monomorium pharaonis TaxID=307658 RepID=UPI0017470C9D|nr:uncharacterized protein LOC118645194 [Monomorium pharaonis]